MGTLVTTRIQVTSSLFVAFPPTAITMSTVSNERRPVLLHSLVTPCSYPSHRIVLG